MNTWMDDNGENPNEIASQSSLSSSNRSSSSLNSSNNHYKRDIAKDSQEDKEQTVIRVIHEEETPQMIVEFGSNCEKELDICADQNGPSILINIPEIFELCSILRNL